MSGRRVSVVVTVRNEEGNLRHLLDSLVGQQHLHEVVLVDALSTDRTVQVARSYESRLPLRIVVEPCSRGQGRNIGARLATGDLLAFTDGDCIANARWTDELLRAWDGHTDRVVAGKTVLVGYWAFTALDRVELPNRGQDTSWPSCNLAYPKQFFDRLGGFDAAFVTAEDIDLNYRAVQTGASIAHAVDAIVYARARESIAAFLRQAYWNGYGRKQLTLKHGRLWSQYRMRDLLRRNGTSAWGWLRMAAGLMGYMAAKFGRKPR